MQSLLQAERLAQKIVAFDVNDIADEPAEDRIVDLMVQVAQKMKQYRPYLPPELFATDSDDETDGGDTDDTDVKAAMCDDLMVTSRVSQVCYIL